MVATKASTRKCKKFFISVALDFFANFSLLFFLVHNQKEIIRYIDFRAFQALLMDPKKLCSYKLRWNQLINTKIVQAGEGGGGWSNHLFQEYPEIPCRGFSRDQEFLGISRLLIYLYKKIDKVRFETWLKSELGNNVIE